MLNPRWEKVYDPQDLKDWGKLEGTAPPVVYPFQHQILYRLLGKYYRTNKGNQLHPENPRFLGAFFDMLSRTMHELEKQVALKEDFEARQWEEQRLREEDPIDKILREDELRRDSSLKKISLREEVDLGRFWISPLGSVMSPSKELHHGEWMLQHPEVLDKREEVIVQRHPNDLSTIMEYLFADGWIRISGGIAEMYSEFQMPKLARFLESHSFDAEADSSIIILMHDSGKEMAMKISEIISKYGDDDRFELQANIISYRKASNVPNPLRKNYDYSSEMGGPEWQNRVKNFEKKKEPAGGKNSCGIQNQKK